RGVRRPRKVRICLSLCHVLGAGESERRHFCLCQVIDRCEQFERGEGTENDVDLVTFDNLLGLVLGAGRVTARVRDYEIDLATRKREILILEKRADAFLEMNAPGGERSGLHREQAYFERRILCYRRHGKDGDGSRGSGKKLATTGPVSHVTLPPGADFTYPIPRNSTITRRTSDRVSISRHPFSKSAENRKNQRFAFQIVSLGFAGSAIDLFPGFRDVCHLRLFSRALRQSRGQPAVDQIHESLE